MLTTFECPQCGMPFLLQTNESGSGFAAVDRDLWIDTCLDNDVDRDHAVNGKADISDCASRTCVYVQEAASRAERAS